ncbi:type IA DNA topoisomerase [Weissella paramesenteroides]|uniref:type IA DNA topoisomerase n=1 Tax=Weissella paramesenteroides TaxID=1249 RepID=UPI0021B06520|nr:type IA DNA topoisomerase [Weissella paramesenteroides]MCS9983551.1 type IA DNA topoisomerase [Weissella paramesenteroides]MCS9997697.1 type IA DNA topoisomerase [Weissella paramesenteroides]MCT0259617.1 type IA DNA topoisomerase [Weissella paramesenteroides]
MTTIILAEKPSQARSYVQAFQNSTKKQGYFDVSDPVLPENTKVTFGFGHLVELATPDEYDSKYKKWALSNLPIFPEKYKFAVGADKKKQFGTVKELLNQADTIIIATDSDREGENIAWSIMTKSGIDLKSKILKRLWINSLEKEVILDGFKNLKDGWDYYPAYQEAQTRQISDWLVGMNGSPLYTLLLQKAGVKGIYSIGRVQTPTLYMIYQRDLAIKNFKPEPYFELNAKVSVDSKKFDAKLEPYKRFKDEKQLITFMDDKNVQKGNQDGLIKDVQKQQKKSSSPRLFSLSSLQSEINKRYHASASDTLKAVQLLYEAKLLTYPRTDCNYITDQEFSYLVDHLEAYSKLLTNQVSLTQVKPQARYVNGKKVQEHHAIIMTKTVPTTEKLNSLSKLEKQVYDMVLRTTLAMFTDPYEYEETTILTQIGQAIFKATGKVTTNQGWKLLFKMDVEKTDKTDKEETILPVIEKGQVVKADLSTDRNLTKAPVPFTEGTLITAMKTAGKTLDDEEAQAVLKDTEGIGTEATRANILDGLKKRGYLFIQKNKVHVSEQGMTLCKAVELEPLLTSPEMTAKWEVALKQIGQKKRTQENFLGQIQRFVQKLVAEVPEQLQQSESLTQQVTSQKMAENEAKKDAEIGICPICKQGKIIDKGNFYGCTNYKADQPCKFTLPKKWSDKTITKTIVKTLLTKGTTNKLKGFQSKKTGKEFSAKLVLKAGRLSFEF